MSLVNDMLRDLDQRRKDSEGTAAARIRLTPAGDNPRPERKNYLPAIVGGLVILAGGLGYTWMQLNSGTTTRLIAPTSIPEAPVNPVTPESAPSQAEIASDLEQIAALSESAEEPVVEEVLPEPPAQEQVLALSELNVAADPDRNVPVIEPVERSNTPASNAATSAISRAATTPVRTQSLAPVVSEQVKGVTRQTPEQQDTLVVQEALQLIANNQTTGAFAKLEQHLLDNPFAHQSRETYAKFLMNQGDIHSAAALVESGLQLAPNHSGFKKVKARLLITSGDIGAAVNVLESRAPAVAEDLEYHEILASAQLASRDFDGATLSYTGLVQQDQSQGRWWYGFAAAQDAMGNVVAARQAYSRAIEQANLSTNLRRRSQDRLTLLGQ